MLKIRRPLGRLIFNMGIAIPGKTVFLIETAPWAAPRRWQRWYIVWPQWYRSLLQRCRHAAILVEYPSNQNIRYVTWSSWRLIPQEFDCLINILFRLATKKAQFRITDSFVLCGRNPKIVSRHHGYDNKVCFFMWSLFSVRDIDNIFTRQFNTHRDISYS